VQAAFLVSAPFAGRSPLGPTASSTSTTVKRLLPFAAAPAALAGIAAFALGHTSGTPAVTDAIGQQQGTATAASPQASAAADAQLVSITQQPATGVPVVRLNASKVAAIPVKGKHHAPLAGKHHRTLPATYTVKPGETLASIAQNLYAGADYWTVLYWANHAKITDANQIGAGLQLTVPAKPGKIPAAPKAAPAAPVTASTASSASTTSAPAQTATVSSGSSSSFQACVIAAESGGNAQVMNASGHYGLYQFSAATWAAYGGNPADFGHASVAEQNQVFDNAIAAGGASNWSQYDGC
jgi:Transglycosylase-like domain/LysM domain